MTGTVASPWAPPPELVGPGAAEPPSAGRRLDALAALVAGLAALLLGAPLGLLWAALAPRAGVIVHGAGNADLTDAEPTQFIADDGVFLLLAVLAGVLLGVLAWRWGRQRAPWTTVGLALGGLAGAYVAARVGGLIGRTHFLYVIEHGPAGHLQAVIRLRSRQELLGWPAGSGLATLLLLLRDRGREGR